MKTTNDGKNPVPRHLDDADLISYLDGELSHAEQEYARTHLERCWNCRSQLLAVQNSIESFLRVRKQVLPAEIPPSGPAVAQFRRRLAEHASVPVSLRLRLTSWLSMRRWRELLPNFNLILKYRKTSFASALVVLVLFFTVVDPFHWNRVSADELLNRADTYEFLHELPAGRVARARVRIDRIAHSAKATRKIGEVETARDPLTSGMYISAELASGAVRKATLPDSEKLTGVDFFTRDLKPETAKYLDAQGWFPQVSVSAYRRLIAGRGFKGNEDAFVTRHGDSYELHHPFAPSHFSGITETVLLLSAENYSPEALSIFTAEGNERFEYRLTRTAFERVERTPELAQLFEVKNTEVGLAPEGKDAVTRARGNAETITASPRLPVPLSPLVATAELEVEVLNLLHQAGADVSEQVSVQRTSDGLLAVEGIVETDKRKAEILQALSAVANNPSVRIDIQTVAEASERLARQNKPPARATVERVEVNKGMLPVESELRRHFSENGERADEQIRQFAARVVNRSQQALFQASALKRLAKRFTAEQLRTLDPEARAKWLGIIRGHAGALRRETASLRQELQPIFSPAEPSGLQDEITITDDADLARAIDRLYELASDNDRVIRSAFTLSTGASAVSAIQTPQFWRSLRSAETLAEKIGAVARP